jgi:Ca2+-binding RTX toxin-like protein
MCIYCGFRIPEQDHYSNAPETGSGQEGPSAIASGSYSLAQRIQALRTNWGGTAWSGLDARDPGDTISWADNPIRYKLRSQFRPEDTDASDDNEDYWVGMTATETARIPVILQRWADLIARPIQQVIDTSFETDGTIEVAFWNRTDKGSYTVHGNFDDSGSSPYNTDHYELNRAEVWLNRNWNEFNGLNPMGVNDGGVYDMAEGSRAIETILHEFGHALGLSHPSRYNAGDGQTPLNVRVHYEDNRRWSIMSYVSETEGGPGDIARWDLARPQVGTADLEFSYAVTPMVDDIAAIQAIYGANPNTRLGNTRYGFSSNNGAVGYSHAGQPFDFNANGAPILSIYDSGGRDILDFSGFNTPTRINLLAGGYSSTNFNQNDTVSGTMNENVGLAYNNFWAGSIIEDAVGGSNNDSITGNAAANWLSGLGGNDTLSGDVGSDSLYGGSGSDILYGGSQNDLLYGESEWDLLYGEDGDDLLEGGERRDTLFGGNGSDTLNGGNDLSGDSLYGGSGDDQITGGGGDDLMYGEAGNDTLFSSGGYDTMAGGAGNDVLNSWSDALDDVMYGEDGNDVLVSGGGRDTLYGNAGDDTLVGGAGSDFLDGGDGSDLVSYDFYVTEGIAVTMVDATTGKVTGGDGASSDTLVSIERYRGTSLNDTMRGNVGNDYFEGAGGQDYLAGDDGLDRLDGGFGDDTLNGGAGGDVLIGGDFNEGSDWALYDLDTASISINLSATVLGSSTGYGGSANGDLLSDIENLWTGSGNDSLVGNARDNIFIGGAGNDTLLGGDGDDTISGGAGADSMDGGAGTEDVLSYRGAGSSVSIDRELGKITGGGADPGDTFANFEFFEGSEFDDTYNGTAQADQFSGFDGNDFIRTGDAVDNIFGGNGNDTMVGGNGGDLIQGGGGIDTSSYVDSTAGVLIDLANVDAGKVTGRGGAAQGDTLVDISNLVGSDFGDTLIGNAGANGFSGGAGADVLRGSGGDDVLSGDAGADLIAGDAGNDTLFGGDDGDRLFGDKPINTVNQTTSKSSFLTYTLASPYDVGTAMNRSLDSDVLNSTTVPFITISANSSNAMDFYAINIGTPGATITLDIDNTVGTDDTIIYLKSPNGNTLASNDDSSISSGAGGSTSGLNSFLQFVVPAAGTYIIQVAKYSGGTAVPIPSGSSYELQISVEGDDGFGADRIDGGLGQDYMVGGGGNDTIVSGSGNTREYFETVTTAANAVAAEGGGGADTIVIDRTGASMAFNIDFSAAGNPFSLPALSNVRQINDVGGVWYTRSIEFLDFTGGSGNDTVKGGINADRLNGGLGADSLMGEDGDDSLEGGAGADVLNGGDGFDYATYKAGSAAVQVVYYNTAYNLGDAVGDVYTAIEGFIGTGFGDTLVGGFGVDVIGGGLGDDWIDGTFGGDALFGEGGNDNLASRAQADYLDGGADFDYARYDYADEGLRAYIYDTSQNSGWAAGDGFISIEGLAGSYFADDLRGDANQNIIYGLGGADYIIGLGGSDLLIGGDGQDLFHFVGIGDGGPGGDAIQDFVSGQDRISVTGQFFGLGSPGGVAIDSFRFVAGTAANLATSQFIYNGATRQLFYDIDGTGAGAQVLLATLQAGASLAAGDIIVI